MNYEPGYTDKENADEWTLNDKVAVLLESQEIKDLPAEEQGKVVLDQFVGMLMRKGDILTSGNESMSPEFTLRTMAELANDKLPNGLTEFTRNQGMRDAVAALVTDERTHAHIKDIEDFIHIGSGGEQVLGSIDQVEGYIAASTNDVDTRNHSYIGGWERKMREYIHNVVHENHKWSNNLYHGMIESDNDTLRKKGIEIQKVHLTAEKAGMNWQLLGKSAEFMKRRKDSGHDIGAQAVSALVQAASEEKFRRWINPER